MTTLDDQIRQWRTAVLRDPAVDVTDADELETHLREQIADLEAVGMSPDEAFLIGVKRLGEVNSITAEFAREHGDRLWKQLTVARPDGIAHPRPVVTMLAFSALAVVLIQAARLLASVPPTDTWFVPEIVILGVPVLSAAFAVFPVLEAYFAVRRRLPWPVAIVLGVATVLLAVVANLFPFAAGASTAVLVAIHLPVLLWFVVGAAYVGGDVRSSVRRMDFIRFTGEWAIYCALIALGGIVLMGLTIAVLMPIAPDIVDEVIIWVVPSGAAAGVIVAAWLVEAKKSVVENLAPVLTAIFTPLFAVMLLVAVVAYLVAGLGVNFDRELLTVFDVLLLVVVGLVVYGISARDVTRRPGVMAVIQLVAVIAAVILDVLVLVSMFGRVGEFGFTANRVAALGLNLLLLVNLTVTAWLSIRMLTGRDRATRLDTWQTGYLVVFAAWVAFVVLALPPAFAFA